MKNSIIVLSLILLMAGLGCTTPARSTRPASSAQIAQSQMFGSAHVKPEGNAALHYLDSRLEKLQSRDPQALEAMRQAVLEDPKSPYLHAELARHLAEAEQFEQASLESDRALELAPDDANLYLLKGKLNAVKKKSLTALAAYDRCIELDPSLEECHIMKAREFVMGKDYNRSRNILKNYIQKNPGALDSLFFLATLYTEEEKDFPQAEKYLNLALDEDPHHLKSLTALSQLYLKQKKFDEALEVLLQLERSVPNDVATKLRVGLLYYERENFPEAIKRFSQALALQSKNDRVHYYLGILEAQNKNYTQAISYFKKVSEKSEYYRDARIRMAYAYGEIDKLDEALKVTKEALNNKKDEPDLYEILGTLYAKKNQDDKALKAFDRGLKRFPGQENLLYAKGVLLDKMDRFDEAAQTLQQILEVNPEHADALNYLGYSYVDRNIHLQESLEMLQKAHQLRPNDGYITDSLAWAYFKLGQLDQAQALLEEANRLSPNEPTILEHLGDLYLKLGQKQKAKAYYQDAVAAAIKVKDPNQREKKDLNRIQDKLAQLSL